MDSLDPLDDGNITKFPYYFVEYEIPYVGVLINNIINSLTCLVE